MQELLEIMLLCTLFSVCISALTVSAEMNLTVAFRDHMALQRDQQVRIWGEHEPGKKITGSGVEDSESARVGRYWGSRAELPALISGGKTHSFGVTSSEDTSTFSDLLIGEVLVAASPILDRLERQFPPPDCDLSQAR